MRARLPWAVLLFAAVLLVSWLAIRSHPAASPTGDVPARRGDVAASAAAPITPTAVQPSVVPPGAPATNSVSPAPTVSAPSPAVAGQDVRTEPTSAVPPSVTSPASSRAEAASINAIRVRRMITDYHTLTGENPVGTNAEIMAAVMGKNPRQATLGPPEGIELNSQGELVDAWGTPYFFHQLSRDVMEIHSAGPDKVMGTADDIVVR